LEVDLLSQYPLIKWSTSKSQPLLRTSKEVNE